MMVDQVWHMEMALCQCHRDRIKGLTVATEWRLVRFGV
jgi:hypothetical protein